MSTISLCTNQVNQVTIVSNLFIDNYMPGANGSYVKVYLYLLRCISNNCLELSVPMLADHLDNTENDIIRALSYWEKLNLISLVRNNQQDIIGITFNNIEDVAENNTIEEAPPAIQSEPEIAPVAVDENSKMFNKFDKPTYTPAQIDSLVSHDEIKWIMNIIEIYLERVLRPADVQLILYLYENIGFPADLILYLYEYCVSKNKKNASYIEAVALSWANDGIFTVEAAENSTTLYNTNYQAVNKAFGLNRAPGNIEKQYINKWMNKYHFTIDIIVEACNRTLLRTGKPDFKYADKIMENWFGQNVKTLNDIEALDKKHVKQTGQQAASKVAVSTQTRPNNNKFTAFAQRTYTKEDFSKMEQHLLNKK